MVEKAEGNSIQPKLNLKHYNLSKTRESYVATDNVYMFVPLVAFIHALLVSW